METGNGVPSPTQVQGWRGPAAVSPRGSGGDPGQGTPSQEATATRGPCRCAFSHVSSGRACTSSGGGDSCIRSHRGAVPGGGAHPLALTHSSGAQPWGQAGVLPFNCSPGLTAPAGPRLQQEGWKEEGSWQNGKDSGGWCQPNTNICGVEASETCRGSVQLGSPAEQVMAQGPAAAPVHSTWPTLLHRS